MRGPEAPRPRIGAGVAALLSALIPGLGQFRFGARRGVLIALPFFGVVVVGVVLAIANPHGALETILRPGVIGAIVALVAIVGAYHLGAVLDAFRLGRRRSVGQKPVGAEVADALVTQETTAKPPAPQQVVSRPPGQRRLTDARRQQRVIVAAARQLDPIACSRASRSCWRSPATTCGGPSSRTRSPTWWRSPRVPT